MDYIPFSVIFLSKRAVFINITHYIQTQTSIQLYISFISMGLPCEVIPVTEKPGVFLTLLNCDLVRLREAVQYQQHLFSQTTLKPLQEAAV